MDFILICIYNILETVYQLIHYRLHVNMYVQQRPYVNTCMDYILIFVYVILIFVYIIYQKLHIGSYSTDCMLICIYSYVLSHTLQGAFNMYIQLHISSHTTGCMLMCIRTIQQRLRINKMTIHINQNTFGATITLQYISIRRHLARQ